MGNCRQRNDRSVDDVSDDKCINDSGRCEEAGSLGIAMRVVEMVTCWHSVGTIVGSKRTLGSGIGSVVIAVTIAATVVVSIKVIAGMGIQLHR